MFEDFSNRSKAVRATMELAAARKWSDVTLSEIATRAGLELADLRREFVCKSDILRAFQSEVDAQVLSKVKPSGENDTVRDRVFDMIMTRFELMEPYKPAMKRIAAYMSCHPGEASLLACSSLASQYWTLAGAGAKLGGAHAAIRVAGLSAVYSKAFNVWLEDDSESLDKTMAALDRGLSNGERTLKKMDKVCETLCGLMPRGWQRKSEPKDQPSSEAGTARA
jgi:ubiquinone biosynthesis protein COQ9